VLGAAMWPVDNVDIPGVDVITASSIGETLDPAHGDQLADWSATPIYADFGGGWRLRDRPGIANEPDDDELPDFAFLFPIRDDDEDWQFTPLT
jgi:hypothetical protein